MKFRSPLAKIGAGVLALATTATALPVATAAETAQKIDGKTSATAAASCWEIKQLDPASNSGSYWLYTPQMEAPAQFYCDQETNGGGWVMIGRGREGWTEDYMGKGKADDLATNPDGTDAFSPVQLESKTVDALMGGKSPSSLEDGLRFKRATNAEGTQFQNAYAKRMNMDRWSWTLGAKANWSGIRFDNPAGLGTGYSIASTVGNVGDWDSRYNALVFTANKGTNWLNAFNFGYYIRGNTSATSYLWSPTSVSASAFTQVYVRPKLTQDSAGFATIADTGLSQEEQRQLPSSYSSKMQWRTSLESATGNVGEMNTPVQAIAEVNNTVFTGGDFKNISSASGETVDQSFLAGYDVNTGDLVRTFRPTFNGQIKALEGLSNGKLAVGGEFTQVNGQDVSGFVVLDPVTGEIDRTYDWVVQNRLASDITRVKTIQEANGFLYIGGSFTHVKGNTSQAFEYSRNAARFNMSNGSVDWNWNPEFNGTVNGISASTDQSNVYAAGYFTTNRGEATWKLANMNTTDGRLKMPWNWKLSYDNAMQGDRKGFQFDVQDADSSVFAGGAEHLIAQYNKADLSRMSSSITKRGGDFQDLHRDARTGVIYGACHCENWVYQNGDLHDNPWSTSTNINRIRMVGAFDEKTGEYLPDFNPMLTGQYGNGIWESFVDSTGVLWVGGDISKTLGASGTQDTVGFARYAPRDITPAAAPNNLTVTTDGTTDKLQWQSGTAGKTAYQVLRNDRVIATVTNGTAFEVPHVDGARYFVRSVDQAGNYSATTPVAVAPEQASAAA
ncbi:fibrinogen-like YCDxxxxGGGW domain-containing protein [Rothia terrae]|uniref:fibrinogen-like YCDxxxxGGGW domain-containing protein n=1 Tax=Rothia terrae TaxID=396015 RepID=UPI0037F45B8E